MAKTNERVDAFRRFNRFYTSKIGILARRLLDTPYSLSEARILFELAQQEGLTVSELVDILKLDAGYVSRIVSLFKERGLLLKDRTKDDGRRRILKLSDKGRGVFKLLNDRARDQAKVILKGVTEEDQIRLVRAMTAIEDILGNKSVCEGPILIRSFRSGDIGWIVQRHGAVYDMEYRFDETFEALVAEILGRLVMKYDHKRDHIWMAEIDGERVGSIVIAGAGKTVAKLRLFLVEPWARGRGIGKMLLKECIRFARQAGYRRLVLWTQSILTTARHLYELEGFRLVKEYPHSSFGHDLVAETWELKL
jgi:DNA-binding MarR family transcriptional regulator/GNAT superfamily N-acetyltransferase